MTITVNPDKQLVDNLRRRIQENGGYCVCAITRDDDHKCICKDFLEQQTDGYCHCGLYSKIN